MNILMNIYLDLSDVLCLPELLQINISEFVPK